MSSNSSGVVLGGTGSANLFDDPPAAVAGSTYRPPATGSNQVSGGSPDASNSGNLTAPEGYSGVTVINGGASINPAFASLGASDWGGSDSAAAAVLKQYRSGSADGSQGYDIWITFQGRGWTTDLQAAFTHAADYFTSVITADVGGGVYQGKFIDDVTITAQVIAIDGPGGVLGQAGPLATWNTNELTAAGQMQFDKADAANYLTQGLWDEIVTHEMMHVLGFGSLWNFGNNPLVPTAGQYIGQNGLAAYIADGHPGATYIPVETDGGSGTAGAHWDEDALGNELMTGYIDSTNYLSKFSVMSLQDLGYTVGNYHDYTNLA